LNPGDVYKASLHYDSDVGELSSDEFAVGRALVDVKFLDFSCTNREIGRDVSGLLSKNVIGRSYDPRDPSGAGKDRRTQQPANLGSFSTLIYSADALKSRPTTLTTGSTAACVILK